MSIKESKTEVFVDEKDFKKEIENNQLTKVLNIPSAIQYTEKKLKKNNKNFIVSLIISLTTMCILLGIVVTIAISIAIKTTSN